MSTIKHQIENYNVDLLIAAAEDLIPDIPVEILKAGDHFTTVEFEINEKEQEQEVLVFITEFEEQNK